MNRSSLIVLERSSFRDIESSWRTSTSFAELRSDSRRINWRVRRLINRRIRDFEHIERRFLRMHEKWECVHMNCDNS
jgi:hypothetical protein